MQVSDIIDGIIAKKDGLGMTSQQLADSSGVPKSTVDRILRKDTPNPSLQTVLDLAGAVGYTFSNQKIPSPTQEKPDTKDPMVTQLITVYENRGQMYEERIKQIRGHYYMLLAEKNRWIKFSMALNIILVVAILSILIFDVLHPDVGWIREQLFSWNSAGTNNIFLAIWLGL